MSDQYSTVDALPEKPRTVDDLAPEKPAEWKGPVADDVASQGSMGAIMHAFGQGFQNEWGTAKVGPELHAFLEKHGILYNGEGEKTVAKAFNEAFVRPAVSALDVSLRTISGTFEGTMSALREASYNTSTTAGVEGTSLTGVLSGTAVALIEAFPLGKVTGLPGLPGRIRPPYTGGVGSPVDLRVAKDLDVIGPMPEMPRTAEAAAAQVTKPITAYHGSPYSFDAFKSEKIGTGEGAQSYGHGIYLAENAAVAKDYAKRTVPSALHDELAGLEKQLDVLPEGNARDAVNERIYDIENEIKTTEGNHYQVRVNANPEHFLDWDKPLSEQSQFVQDALKPLLKKPAVAQRVARLGPNATIQDIYGAVGRGVTEDFNGVGADLPKADRAASNALAEAGIPGIRYLDQGSRPKADKIKLLNDLIQKTETTISSIQEEIVANRDNKQMPPRFFEQREADIKKLQDANARDRAEINDLAKQPDGTRNMVIFNERDIEITHKNGEPVNRPVPEPVPEAKAAGNPNNLLVKRGSSAVTTEGSNPWRERFEEWVKKLQVPEDVKTLIRNASEDNNTFPEARAGQVPEERLGALSDATGIPRNELPEALLRQTFKNDAEFRVAAQLMIKTNDDVFAAARDHSAQPTFESRKALVAAMMRRDLALESVLGLRAEWGRTGNVMQEFLDSIKDAQGLGKFIKDKKGGAWDSAKLDETAKMLAGLKTPAEQARFLRETRKPDFLDKAIWYWTNAVLSGVITHTKYIFANAAYLAHDTLIATPLAGVAGAVRAGLGAKDLNRVYLGETFAKAYGLIAGVPDAVMAAGRAAKTGVPTPLPVQAAGAGAMNPVTGLSPIPGIAGTVLGVPSRGISAIHSFYNFLGYRAELEALGYRQAAKEGHSPLTPDFWKAQHGHVMFPDDPAMDASILAGQRANFVQDLGPTGKSIQNVAYQTRLGRFVLPFLKVPGNIVNEMQAGTPFAFLDSRMRADLLGKNGGPAADMARGRVAGGAAIMATAAYWTLQDTITGHGPVDTKERAEWLLTHQPRSVKIGDRWYSYDQFGPIGGWLSLSADLTDTATTVQQALADKRITAADEARHQKNLVEAYSRTVVGFTHWFEEAGFQGLFNLIEAMNDPQKTHASNAGATVASALPFSSFQRQQAAFMDPVMRDTKTFLDGIRNAIPGQREMLPVARDWTGAPRPNPAYQSIVKARDVNADPVDLEMQRLDLKPAAPPDNIRGVKLTRQQYDDFQDHAGIATRMALHGLISAPGWAQTPAFARAKIITNQITAARNQAEAYMMATYPNLIREGVDNKIDVLMGVKPIPKAYRRPE